LKGRAKYNSISLTGHFVFDQLHWLLDVRQNQKIDGFPQLMQLGRRGVAPTQGVDVVWRGHRLAVLRAGSPDGVDLVGQTPRRLDRSPGDCAVTVGAAATF
jgi:hypothetical protein